MSCQPQPMIVVRDVEASSRWYQKILGCKSGHGGAEYEQLVLGKRIILQLHPWERHGHGYLGKRSLKSRGNGVLLWFEIEDFARAVRAVRRAKAKILLDVHINPNARHQEIWFKDPDGYTVVLAGPSGAWDE